jgi:hypothetical protein
MNFLGDAGFKTFSLEENLTRKMEATRAKITPDTSKTFQQKQLSHNQTLKLLKLLIF